MRVVRYYPRALLGDGGLTGAVRRWSETLAQLGAQAVIAYDGDIDPPWNSSVEWVKVRHVGRSYARVPVGVDEVFRGADLVVLHSGWVSHGVRAAAAARSLGVPYLLEPRGAYDPMILDRKAAMKKLWWTLWERRLVMNARAIHVFFESQRSHVRALGYPGPFVVASNGIDSPAVSWDGGSGGYILWLGRFDPQHKGLDLLIEGVGRIPEKERPHLRLHGPDWRGRKHGVVEKVRDIGLDPWIEVGPPVYGDEKVEVLSKAAGFVYPSRWEGCGNSVLEAVAMGVPTLVTPYPLGEVLASRGGAFLADASPAGMAEGLPKLTTSDAAAVGRRGAEVVRDEFSWPIVVRSWLSQLETLI